MQKEKQKYISLQEATKFCSYSAGYLKLRAIQRKLKAIKIGRNWATTKEWIEEYVERMRRVNNNRLPKKGPIRIDVKFEEEETPQEQLPELYPPKVTETPLVPKVKPKFVLLMTLTLLLIMVGGFLTLPNFMKQNLGGYVQEIGQAVDQEIGESLTGMSQLAEVSGIKGIGQGIQKGAKNLASTFRSWISDLAQFVTKPFKREVAVKEEKAEKEEVIPEDLQKEILRLSEEIETLKLEGLPIREITKEVTRVTQIEPIREITREVIQIDESALAEVKASLAVLDTQVFSLEKSTSRGLYVPSSAPTTAFSVSGNITEGGVALSSKYISIPGGSLQGDILIGSWSRLAAGATGQFLQTQGAGADPVWAVPAPATGGGWTDDGAAVRLTTVSDSIGIGTASPNAKLELLATTEQFRLSYDASNRTTFTVDSTGAVTFDAVGTGAGFTFSDSVTIPPSSLIFSTASPVTISATNPAADRTYTIPDFGSNDSFVGLAANQTLTNKTLGAFTLSGDITGSGLPNITGIGTISTSNFAVTNTMTSGLDMGNNLITNIGATGTDFTSGGGLTLTADLTVTGGDIILGTTSIFSGGDTASLNNIDVIDATTETTLEDAIDALSNLTTVGTITSGTWEATDVGLAHGGTGASLTDPNADRIFFWDDSATSTAFLTLGSTLSISTTTLDAVDLSCTDCLNATEIEDIYLLTAGDTMGGGLDMASNLITNIGDTGTDFVSGGGLTLAGVFTANGTATFNADVTLTLVETENLALTNSVSGTNTVDLISATLTNSSTSGTQNIAYFDNAASTGTTESILVIDNSDADTAVTNAIQFIDAGGGFTNLFNNAGTLISSAEFNILDANIDLTSEITGVLPIANGGTNKALTVSAGGIPYFDADSFEVLVAGTSGQLLTSGGTGVPTWTTQGTGGGLDADTLDTIDSLSFLRSNTSDTFTSGTLTFNDSIILALGSSNDFTISHGGTNTVFDNTFATGATQFQLGTDTNATSFQVLNNTGTNLFEVDGSGKVGIGTSSPQSLLDVQGPTGVGSASAGILTLATKELTILDADQLGRINFNAPLATPGGDSILAGAAIWAEADATFTSSINNTELVFATATTSVAIERMRIDSAGLVGIGTSTPSTALDVVGYITALGFQDDDGDTKIQVEESTDEDIIRFDLAGTEKWVMQGSRLEPMNTGNSVFIGEGAGATDDLTDNFNTAIGYNALNANTTGSHNAVLGYQALMTNTSGTSNVAIGAGALKANTVTGNVAIGFNALTANTTGIKNVGIGSSTLALNTTGATITAIGYQAGFSNTTGWGSVFLGHLAGYFETASNKLYIDNSNTTTPLIYGDFNTDALTINGSLTTTGTITFSGLTTDGVVTTTSGVLGSTALSALDAGTLDSLDSLQFLRSDASDAFTSGTLTFNDSTILALGSSNDFTISHGGTNTVFDNIFATGATIFQLGTDTNATAFQVLNDTGATLFEVDGAGAMTVNGNTTLGDASGDTVTIDAGTLTLTNDLAVTLSGGVDGINFASNTLSIDAANSRVGIGTAAPTTALEVVGDITSKGTSWTSRTSAADNGWVDVTYGNGLFVAVGQSSTGSRVMTSPDGVNWTTRTSAADNTWTSVTYGNGIFVAVSQDNGGGNQVMTSSDGINWTSRNATAVNQWQDVTYGNGIFVAVSQDGSNRVMTSPDGINWISRSAATVNQWRSITYGNGLFVAVSLDGTTNQAMTSTDGITWTSETDESAATNAWNRVTHGNGLFVAVASTGTNRVMTSPDGTAWTGRSAAAVDTWSSVTYGNGLFVATAPSDVMTSPDGITWTSRNAPDNNWLGVTYGNGIFVAVSNDSVGDNVMTSGKTEISALAHNNIFQGGMSIFGNVGIGDSSPSSRLEVGDGTDSLQISSVGDLTFVDADGTASITGPAGGALTVAAGSAQALTLTANAASTWSTSTGILTLTGDDGVIINASNTAGITFNVPDAIDNAINIKQGSDEYINIVTSDGTENISFGNTNTNPSFDFLGTGLITIVGAGAETNSLTLTTGNITLTDGDLIISSGEIAATADDTTGTSFSFTGVNTTGDTLGIVANALTSGDALTITSTSTAGLGSDNTKLLNIARSGANSIASHTAYGIYSAVTNTGTTSTNVAGYFSASGATNNYGLIVENGSVGIGTTNPNSAYTLDTPGIIHTTNQLRAREICDAVGANCKNIRNTRWSRLSGDGPADSTVKISDSLNGGPSGLDGSDFFGSSVANIGDLDGDGVTDLAVGAYQDENGDTDEGALHILFMNTNGTVKSTVKISDALNGGPSGLDVADNFGVSVANIGDLDGDGVTDLAVGAFHDENVDVGEGALFILFMNTNGTAKSTVKISDALNGGPSGLDANDSFGSSVANIGDLDGDGITDLAVGARSDENGDLAEGALFILFMNTNGTAKSTVKISDALNGGPSGLDASDNFGNSVANIGDLDGDGVTDLAVGAYQDENGDSAEGALFILFMNTNGTAKSTVKISDALNGGPSGLDATDLFGSSVANIGDLDGDGVTDLAVGAYNDENGDSAEGALHILFMNTNGTAKSTVKISDALNGGPSGLDGSDSFGVSVANIGDLDGDGVTDLAVGAFFDENGDASEGALHILFMAQNNIYFASQNVGIGTTAPQSLLDVQGPIGVGAALAGILTLATKELTIVDADQLGRINFNAPLATPGGDSILAGAAIWAEADATFTASVNNTELVFATATTSTAVERMRIDSAGNVGIGTAEPVERLHVMGNLRAISDSDVTTELGSGIIYTQNTIGTIGLHIDVNEIQTVGDNLHLQINSEWDLDIGGGDLFVETAAGNVGIGDTTPDSPLEILSTTDPQFRITNTDGVDDATFGVDTNGDLTILASGGDIDFGNENISTTGTLGAGAATFDGDLTFTGPQSITTTSGDLTLNPSGSIDVNNNAINNIGNANSDLTEQTWTHAFAGLLFTNLEAYGLTATGGPALTLRHSMNTTLGSHTAMAANDQLGNIDFQGSNGTAFFTGARINALATETWVDGAPDSLGSRLEFHTTDNGTATLDLRMTIDESGNVGIGDSTPTEATLVVGSAGAGDIYATFATAGTDTLCWDGTGASLITDCSSLREHKENIEDLGLGLETVLQLQPREFNWIESMGGKRDFGFVAEEVEALEPLLVDYREDSQLSGVRYRQLTALLTNAIQELDLRIEDIASTAPSVDLEEGSFASRFFSSLFTKITDWFADATNGIKEFFAKRIHTEEICLGEENDETCINKDQLDALLRNAHSTGSGQAVSGGGTQPSPPPPAPEPAPEPALEPTPESEVTPEEELEETSTPEPASPAGGPAPEPQPEDSASGGSASGGDEPLAQTPEEPEPQPEAGPPLVETPEPDPTPEPTPEPSAPPTEEAESFDTTQDLRPEEPLLGAE